MQTIQHAKGHASDQAVTELLPGLLLIGVVAMTFFVLMAQLTSLTDPFDHRDVLLGLSDQV
jgi:hypothetical protein